MLERSSLRRMLDQGYDGMTTRMLASGFNMLLSGACQCEPEVGGQWREGEVGLDAAYYKLHWN